ncbi:CUL1 [Cordylochernes scorpioides]|uniref:CUL1 n=1 Tax=Cordylochernes scorpioides TaxID=51811 RepID=A0ABY6K9N4_9ARAC|nr:CUL1 [Cordylochernes scorpioides]
MEVLYSRQRSTQQHPPGPTYVQWPYQDTGISKTTIGRIVTEDLRLKKTPAKFIPRFLTNEQKLCRLATCEDMLEMTRTDPEWKDKIITGDETWVYGYDPETKRQSAEWRGQAEKKRARREATRRLLAAIIWQLTATLQGARSTQLQTTFRSATPGAAHTPRRPKGEMSAAADARATTPGKCHRGRTPTPEESSTAMPYTAPETNPRDPGQHKRSQNDIPVPDFTSISRTVRAVPSQANHPKPRRVQHTIWNLVLTFSHCSTDCSIRPRLRSRRFKARILAVSGGESGLRLWKEPDSWHLVCMPVETRGQKMASEELLKQFMGLMRREKEQEKEEKLKRREEKEEKLKREKEEEERRREQEREEKLKRREEKGEKLKREKEEEERRREEKEEKLKREKEEEERRREREKEERLKRRERWEKWAKMLSGIGVETQGQHKDVDKRIKSLESGVISLQGEPSTAERAGCSAEAERDDLAEEANSRASRVTMLQDDKRRLENAGSLLEGQAKAEGLAERAHRAQSSVDLLTAEVAAERASCGKLENAGSLLERRDRELRAKLQERETSQGARTKATIAGLESQTCQLEEQLEAEDKERQALAKANRRLDKKVKEMSMQLEEQLEAEGKEKQALAKANKKLDKKVKEMSMQLEEQLEAEGKERQALAKANRRLDKKVKEMSMQLEEQLEAEGKEKQALAKANRKLDKKVKEMSMQLEEQLEAEGKEKQALAKANRKLDKKVKEMSMQLEEQLEAEGKERQALAKANRRLDKKVKEMSMRLEDEHRQSEQYRGKDHDANEAKNMDEVHRTESRVEGRLDVERCTDPKEEGKLDAGKGYLLPDRPVFGCESGATPIRPVFDDASSRRHSGLSLRRYLKEIPNLLKRISEIGIELRRNKYGVLADLRRYFRLMAIKSNDWDYLRFIWKKKEDGQLMAMIIMTARVTVNKQAPAAPAANKGSEHGLVCYRPDGCFPLWDTCQSSLDTGGDHRCEGFSEADLEFYNTLHKGRKLQFLYNVSRGEIVTKCYKKPYTIQASLYQMTILLLFNSCDHMKIQELMNITNLNEDTLIEVINILVKSKLLISEDNTLNRDSIIKPNLEYNNKKLKININVPLKTRVKVDEEKTNKKIEEDRIMVIKSAIVRIMKMRKTLSYQDLTRELFVQLKKWFNPSSGATMKALKSLIHKEYIKEMETKDMFEYVA